MQTQAATHTPTPNGAIAPGLTSAQYRLPDGGNLRFSEDAERHDKASAMAGAPRYVRIIKATISRPGNRNSEFGFEAARIFPEELRPEWEKVGRFTDWKESAELDVERQVVDPNSNRVLDVYTLRRFYQAYIEKTQIAEKGLAIEIWGVLNPAQIATLKYQEINTVEQLANLGDGFLAAIGSNGRSLRDKARAYVAANTGEMAKLQEIIDRQDKMESALASKNSEIEQLRAALAAATSGRPAPVAEPAEAPTNTRRRGGNRTAAKVDNVEEDVAQELAAAAAVNEDPDFV